MEFSHRTQPSKSRGLIPALAAVLALSATACGRQASSILRVGQLPINDFPLYVSDGSDGVIYRYGADGARDVLVSGLSSPSGIATDRYNHLYVVEGGTKRLLKVGTGNGLYTVVKENLEITASAAVAVDSFGEVYVNEEIPHRVVRVRDGKIISDDFLKPAGMVFGVNDLFVSADSDDDKVFWGMGDSRVTAAVDNPVNVGIDQMGRVYVTEGKAVGASVYRFGQDGPGGDGTLIAQGLKLPLGLAVDPVGNAYVVEKGQFRVVIISAGQDPLEFDNGLTDPQYITFTQY